MASGQRVRGSRGEGLHTALPMVQGLRDLGVYARYGTRGLVAFGTQGCIYPLLSRVLMGPQFVYGI